MGRRSKCDRKPELVLTSALESLESTEEAKPLPLKQKTYKYELDMTEVTILVRKYCRVLKVVGTLVNSRVVISVQKDEDTPRVFEFVNESFELEENLQKGDKIRFEYQSEAEGSIELVASVTKHH